MKNAVLKTQQYSTPTLSIGKAAKVGKSKRNKKTARQWIKYLDTEIKREIALAKK